MISKEALFEKYNISEEMFEAASVEWDDLKYIYTDFESKKEKYRTILSEFEQEYLINVSAVSYTHLTLPTNSRV